MKVICAGLSKTGTTSMAEALRILGYTVYDYMEHVAYHYDEWMDLYRLGKYPDFKSMYQGVDAVTDLPSACWYEEISRVFQSAKVVLTVRDNEETWLKSWVNHNNIIHDKMKRIFLYPWPFYRKIFAFGDVVDTAVYGSVESTSTVLFKKKYREHNQRVRAVIPKEKLLIFNVKEGWKPLCEFLGCEVPEQDFPRANVLGSSIHKHFSELLDNVKLKVFVSLAVLMLILSILFITLHRL